MAQYPSDIKSKEVSKEEVSSEVSKKKERLAEMYEEQMTVEQKLVEEIKSGKRQGISAEDIRIRG